jgi:hypothetical protein
MNFVVSSFCGAAGIVMLHSVFRQTQKGLHDFEFLQPLPWFSGAVQAGLSIFLLKIFWNRHTTQKIKKFTS